MGYSHGIRPMFNFNIHPKSLFIIMSISPTILIANRGEIAVRIIKSCKKLGYRSVAIYSDADAGTLHTKMADIAIALDGDTTADTYLNVNKIIQIAKDTNTTAIHPGYGFLRYLIHLCSPIY